jgi:hypothetical protein
MYSNVLGPEDWIHVLKYVSHIVETGERINVLWLQFYTFLSTLCSMMQHYSPRSSLNTEKGHYSQNCYLHIIYYDMNICLLLHNLCLDKFKLIWFYFAS